MQVKLSTLQVKHDFRIGPESTVLYNPRTDTVGLLTYNRTIGQPFVLVRLHQTFFGEYTDAIVKSGEDLLADGWRTVGQL